MLKELTICRLGPHEATTLTLNPDSTTTISGPSEAGKSTAIEATCFALWGCGSDGKPLDPGCIREGHDKAEVSLMLKSGLTIERSLTRKKSMTRRAGNGEGVTTYASEQALAARLGKLGDESLRLILAPLAWKDLAAGNARPLRDFLASLLPPANVGAEVLRLMCEAGQTFRVGDPLTEKEAATLRTEANRDASETEGRVREAASRCLDLSAPLPPAPDVGPAQATLDAANAWEMHELACGDYRRIEDARSRAEVAAVEWDQRKAGLPAVPTDTEETAANERCKPLTTAYSAAQGKADKAEGPVFKAKQALETAKTVEDFIIALAVAAVDRAKLQLRCAPVDDVCFTCHRSGWTEATATREKAEADLVTAQAALEEAKAGEPGRRAEAIEAVTEALAKATADRDAAVAAFRTADAALAEADAVVDDICARRSAHAAAVKALGPRPMIPAPATKPAAPAVACPTPAEITAAEEAFDAVSLAKGAASQRAKDLASATKAAREAKSAHDSAVAEATRLDALVAAVRRAPSEIAAKQAETLGDLGPVTFRWGDGDAKSPAVEVLIDGRPWKFASKGKEVVADLWFRAALRRAKGMPWLPLFVDDVTNVGGQKLPDVGGCVVLLETTDDAALTVGE